MLTITSLKDSDLELVPLTEAHIPGLVLAAKDEKIWTYDPFIRHVDDFEYIWLKKTFQQQATQERFVFVIIHKEAIVGTTSFYDYKPKHKRTNLGYTWYNPRCWGTGLNKRVKHLLLDYAFNTLKLERVGFSLDSDNQRSRKALEKLGAVKEGILRRYMFRPDNTFHDTVSYSILASE